MFAAHKVKSAIDKPLFTPSEIKRTINKALFITNKVKEAANKPLFMTNKGLFVADKVKEMTGKALFSPIKVKKMEKIANKMADFGESQIDVTVNEALMSVPPAASGWVLVNSEVGTLNAELKNLCLSTSAFQHLSFYVPSTRLQQVLLTRPLHSITICYNLPERKIVLVIYT